MCVQPGEKSRGIKEENWSVCTGRSELYCSEGAVWAVFVRVIDAGEERVQATLVEQLNRVVDSVSSTELLLLKGSAR